MITRRVRVSLVAGLLVIGVASGRANAEVCVAVDEARDTFSEPDRAAAVLLLTRQFELAGEQVVAPGCPMPYVVSHVQLGPTIVITLSGPGGEREATAFGMGDVPAVYSQMVRSLLTGRPMNAPGIVDRTNVSAAQAAPAHRVWSDSVLYARLGYGAIFGDQQYGGPSVGLIGYRKELDSFGIDVSFMNFQYKSSPAAYPYSAASGMTGSWLKLEALHFATPLSDRSRYAGAGLSWSTTNLDASSKSWNGSGLQGELTVGYELGRASTIRVFVQADAGLPFYKVSSTTYAYPHDYRSPYVSTTESRYAPSLMVSVGLGWQRHDRE